MSPANKLVREITHKRSEYEFPLIKCLSLGEKRILRLSIALYNLLFSS